MRWFLLLAIIFGASSFMLDAFFAHGLKTFLGERYDPEIKYALSTAAHYQLFSSLFLILCVVLQKFFPSPWVYASQLFCVVGVLLFCGALYGKYLLNFSSLARLAPVGGVCFMLAFISLFPVVFWSK